MIVTSKKSGRTWDLRAPRKRKKGRRYATKSLVVHVVDLTEVEQAEEAMYADMDRLVDAEVKKFESEGP